MTINRPDTATDIARENAREATGQFGRQEHTAPELSLRTPAASTPVLGTVKYRQGIQSPIVSTQQVDISSVLDTLSLADVESMRQPGVSNTHVTRALLRSGQLSNPDDWAELKVPSKSSGLDAYIAGRESQGLSDPLTDRVVPSTENLKAVIAAHNSELATLRARETAVEEQKAAAEDRVLRTITNQAHPNATKLVVQVDHHRYPVELYDAAGEWVKVTEAEEDELVEQFEQVLGRDPDVLGSSRTPRVIDLTDKD